MVCKRSLYCWKNGPCASEQARKQIWEDNIRFRESLRDLNQSDHYWSFQISKNSCLCLEGEEFLWERQPLSRRHHYGSLQRLNEVDCASVTHDCNGLKFRNCYVHCPMHGRDIKRADTPAVPGVLQGKQGAVAASKLAVGPVKPLPNGKEAKPEYCHRFKNTLSDSSGSRLKPGTKVKFPSQSNLTITGENLQKASVPGASSSTSCQNIVAATTTTTTTTTTEQTTQSPGPKPKSPEKKGGGVQDKEVNTDAGPTIQESRGDKAKVKKSKRDPGGTPMTYGRSGYTPMSRTTRKTLADTKKVPFVTFGCNNANLDVGTKRTHNVLASRMGVYPNALSAKQQKRDLILKFMQSEKEFQKKCLSQNSNKGVVNHSSLWSIECEGKENKAVDRKKMTQTLPIMSKPPRKLNGLTSHLDPYPYKTYRKPQIYFY